MRTPGPWNFACDSYGKVRHSRKACVYASVKKPGGDELVTVAARIENWDDAKLIVGAVNANEKLREVLEAVIPFIDGHRAHSATMIARIKAALNTKPEVA